MANLKLVLAPDPIFKQKAAPVEQVTEKTRKLMDDMIDTLDVENGVGMAATMVGILQRIVVINLEQDGKRHKLFMVNPEITERSDDLQEFQEASLCYPGIAAYIKRPKYIKASYLDYNGSPQEIAAEGFLATCIQHEIDYLDGKVYLDYLSKLKRDRLLAKMKKHISRNCCHGGVCSAEK